MCIRDRANPTQVAFASMVQYLGDGGMNYINGVPGFWADITVTYGDNSTEDVYKRQEYLLKSTRGVAPAIASGLLLNTGASQDVIWVVNPTRSTTLAAMAGLAKFCPIPVSYTHLWHSSKTGLSIMNLPAAVHISALTASPLSKRG